MIAMIESMPLASVIGGALIGLSAATLLVFNGRIAGISGIFGGLLPTRSDIDRPLLLGAVMFGVGWGLAGYCPGPALVGLVGLQPGVLVFVAAMALGMLLHRKLRAS